jgi:hypothetical protein
MNRTICTLVLIAGLGVWIVTAPAGRPTATDEISFRFVSWGDSRASTGGDVNTTVLSSLSNQANQLLPTFSLFQGDLCNTFTDPCPTDGAGGWKYAINNGAPGNGMFNITFASRGNHDTGGTGLPGWQTLFDMEGVASLVGASNFSTQTEDVTYSFDYAGSHFVSVDVPGDVTVITAAQINWLDNDLTAAEARGVVHSFLFWHGPIYCVDGHCSYTTASGSDAPAGLVAILNNHPSISATFHGHEHVNAYTPVDSTRIAGLTHPFAQFVTGEAGAPAYTCTKPYRYSYCVATPGFVTVDVNGYDFTVNQYLLGGGSTPDHTWTFSRAAPAVSLSPRGLSFGVEAIGATSGTRTVTLSNSGTAALGIAAIGISGGDSGDFNQGNDCPVPPSTLAAGASCKLDVTFSPTATGPRKTLLVITDDAEGSPHKVVLTGVGTAVSLSPSAWDFGSQEVGTSSAAQNLTLTNVGGSPVNIWGIGIGGDNSEDFSQTNSCPAPPAQLAKDSDCIIAVTFSPGAAGTRSASVLVSDDGGGSPHATTLAGTGASALVPNRATLSGRRSARPARVSRGRVTHP